MEAMKILVVDSDQKMRTDVCNALSRQGYLVRNASETLSAIDELEKHRDFQLMICDFHLGSATVCPLFWHLSVNNYSLPSIVFCSHPPEDVLVQSNYPDIITVIAKPDIQSLVEKVIAYAQLLSSSTNT